MHQRYPASEQSHIGLADGPLPLHRDVADDPFDGAHRRTSRAADPRLAVGGSDDDAVVLICLAHERFRFGVAGWKVMSELPSPVNFDAAITVVKPDDLAESIPHGPDPQPYVDAIDKYRAAGFDRISIVSIGDHDETLTFWTDVVRPHLDR
jgi:hypothetical protein